MGSTQSSRSRAVTTQVGKTGRTQAVRTRAAGRNQAGRTQAGDHDSCRRAGRNQAGA
jgi:hypothetical protein